MPVTPKQVTDTLSLSVKDLFQQALIAYRQGNAAEAEEMCWEILMLTPQHADTLNLMAVIARTSGRGAAGVGLASRAVKAKPNFFAYHFNLGLAYLDVGRPEKAITALQEAVRLNPSFVDAWAALGSGLRKTGRLAEAVIAFERACSIQPKSFENANMCGVALHELNRLNEAILWYRKAISLKKNFADAYSNMGDALIKMNRVQEAEDACRQALLYNPKSPQACNNLGNALQAKNLLSDAHAMFKMAMVLDATLIHAQNNLAKVQVALGQIPQALNNFHQAFTQKPDFWQAHSSWLMTHHYLPQQEPQQLLQEHVNWYQRHGAHLSGESQPFSQSKEVDRPLRLGYVSPDLHRHPVGYFLEPVLKHHNTSQFIPVCYSTNPQSDSVTQRLKNYAPYWRDIPPGRDDLLTQHIRQDGIDILFDLAGHTVGHSLLTFARKPAPIQITWMGYVHSTGLPTMDYWLSDPLQTPHNAPQPMVEKTLLMPDDYICYQPPDFAPPIGPLPAVANGHVTFGCANNWAKINPQVLTLWAEILHLVPTARLSLKTKALGDQALCGQVKAFFANLGIPARRLDVLPYAPAVELLAWYNTVDIALDPFPYSGGLTTLESLWMGVPVITLPGPSFASRHTLTHLTHVGIPEFAASTPDHYKQLALAWSNQLSALSTLRATLRNRMAASPVCDGAGFTNNLETRLRQIWQEWCHT